MLYCSCVMLFLFEVSLDSKFERIFSTKKKQKKKNFPKIFQSILCRMDKCNLFLITNVLLMLLPFQYTILCYSSVASVKKLSKGKTILSQAA